MTKHSEQSGAETFLRPGQVRARLGVASSTLWNYVHNELLTPAHRTPGGHARFRDSDVTALEAKLSASPGCQPAGAVA